MTTFSKANGRGKLPGYAASLAATLGESSTSLLLTPLQKRKNCRGRRGDGAGGIGTSRRRRRRYDEENKEGNAAGPLSVAAASLRFVVTVVMTMVDGETATTDEKRPGREDAVFRTGAPEREEKRNEGDKEHDGGVDVNAALYDEEPSQRNVVERRHQRATDGGELGRLTRALWLSGFLEACVYVLGEAPEGRDDRRGRRWASETIDCGHARNRWGELLSASYDLETLALRRAQANALALLRAVCRPVLVASPSQFPVPLHAPHSKGGTAASPASNSGNSDAAGVQGCSAEEELLSVDRSAESSEHNVKGTPGARWPPAAATDAVLTVRRALLTETPLLAGLVRCLVEVVESSTAASWGQDDGELRRCCSTRVAREVCATLGSLLCTDAYQAVATPFPTTTRSDRCSPRVSSPSTAGRDAVNGVLQRDPRDANASGGAPEFVRASDLLSPGSAIPQAVFGALEGVLRWQPAGGNIEEAVGVSQVGLWSWTGVVPCARTLLHAISRKLRFVLISGCH